MIDSFTPVADPIAPLAATPRWPRARLAAAFAPLGDEDAGAFRHLLLFRFAVLNLVAMALLGAAWVKGWVWVVISGDETRLVAIIVVVFLAGLAECARRLIQASADLDQVWDPRRPQSPRVRHYLNLVRGRDGQSRAITSSALKLKLGASIAPVRHIANSLVFLGLIGTVLGFIIALSAIEAGVVADVDAIGPMVSTLISGMSVALYTTLVGSVLNIWLMVNYRLLETGTVRLLTALVELGERHA